MTNYGKLRDHDWAALLRLAGEVALMPADMAARRRHILESLCRIVGGCAGAVFELNHQEGGAVARAGSLLTTNMSESWTQQLGDYLYSPASRGDPFNRRITPALREHGTVVRRAFMSDVEWYRCENFQRTMRPWQMDDRIHSYVPLADGKVASMSLVRERNDPPFSDRDRQVLSLFHEHASATYLVPRSAADEAIQSLPPRLQAVFGHLLHGDAEKQIAFKLSLSRHTIHEYVKALYKRLSVNSRAELLARYR